ncbi:hypothetical protein [Paenibacillus marinisediminis]
MLDIAIECGYEHEQTYIRVFKREYGLPPGECRYSGRNIHLTPPLHLLPENNVYGNLVYGPEMVLIQSFHLIGNCIKLSSLKRRQKCPRQPSPGSAEK